MKKLFFVVLVVVIAAGMAAAQTYTSGSGLIGADILGAHQNGGRGCAGCHAVQSAKDFCERRVYAPAAIGRCVGNAPPGRDNLLYRVLQMVQLLLRLAMRRTLHIGVRVACIGLLLVTPLSASKAKKEKPVEPPPPDLLLEGGRKLHFERSFSSEKEVEGKRGFFTKLVDVVAGEPDHPHLMRPYSIAVDSRGRAVVTDPGANGVHIFDFENHKYKFLERRDKGRESMHSPQCVALDAQDNIYVTDSEAGKIFVFEPNGKFRRTIGSLKGGEGYFKRPTGIAIDSAAQRIYITDTLRDKIFVMDMKFTASTGYSLLMARSRPRVVKSVLRTLASSSTMLAAVTVAQSES